MLIVMIVMMSDENEERSRRELSKNQGSNHISFKDPFINLFYN